MFIARFKYEDSDRLNYVYINQQNQMIGFSIDHTGIKSVQKSLIKKFSKLIRLNDDCILLGKVNDYDVYFDDKTGFRHYIKDGKEDFVMFFNNNGTDAFLYEQSDNQEVNNTKNKQSSIFPHLTKKFVAFGLLFELSFLGWGLLLPENRFDYTVYKYLCDEEYDIFSGKDQALTYDDPIGLINFNKGLLSVDEALELINNSSKLDAADKEFLANSELLQFVLPYYEGTSMQNNIKFRLNGINIRYFDETEFGYSKGKAGYYSLLRPSTINVFDEYSDDYDIYNRQAIIAHEFIHMLQCDSSYNYITESSAELMANEFFSTTFDSAYEEGIKSLKILVDIIGPEPILKLVFGSDDSDFKNVLANNLAYEEYNRLLELFKSKPDDIVESEGEIRNILSNLYKNIYGKDIRDDQNILYDVMYGENATYDFGVYPKRFYFNENEMTEEVLNINAESLSILVEDTSLLDVVEKKVIRKEITWDEYINLKENGHSSFDFDFDLDKLINHDYGVYTTKENWISEGFMVAYCVDYLGMEEVLPDGWEYQYNDDSSIATERIYISNIDNGVINQRCFSVTIPSMKERFNLNTKEDSVQKIKTITNSQGVK